MKLTLSALESGRLAKSLHTPKYARRDLSPGILHFGVGNFHRAHHAMYLHRLFQDKKNLDWAIVGAGVRSSEKAHFESLQNQDFLSTVVEQSATSSRATVIGSMVELVAPANYEEILNRLIQRDIRIVSLTVTEGGYFLTDSGDFDIETPEIQQDANGGHPPKTVFGLIVAALKERREQRLPPFTVMSCDNIPHNGDVSRNATCSLAAVSNPSLAQWIKDNVSFPNSMVDRITPVTGETERRIVKERYHVDDDVPVFCEDFIQWVVEDHFCAGRPRYEDVGVSFVSDVLKFETMKLRILNGGHAIIAYPAALSGIEFAHEAMETPLIKDFLLKVEIDEILPTIRDVTYNELRSYLSVICTRFANPKIGDTIRRLCFDGSHRQPQFILPTILDRLAGGHTTEGLALVSALWCRYCYGADETGKRIEANDPDWKKLVSAASSAREDPVCWLQQKSIYGDLAHCAQFVSSFDKWLRRLWNLGTEATIKSYLTEEKEN
ncbi:Mannitol 2-dehydrogenase [Gracilariopsis chorda]|uniref:mannitol 2-dehydrogenase n=1 Tax=Gracilariopsis chorda TaxID=448386 RepID=A0A2V3IPU8_9FLOR|nr:Mannitol 2-dehydrogenase [Gracilariopsis chorda]|eukprot:PXF44083.1 Mannitol 2-dehydrogenase [Gracilariopsis chorda]